MKKLMLTLIILLATNVSMAQSRAHLCRLWYSNDIFKTYLRLSIDPPGALGNSTTKFVLWMDKHIPYGIRPFPYEVSKVLCDTKTSLQITAQAPGGSESVEFRFDAMSETQEWQTGTLQLFDSMGMKRASLNYECSLMTIQNFCENLGQ
ncbi:hypothetical protein [Bdellovibrio bacteriovorus]|uniref:hypothetical protein n=1 Tax=Bdellovibrio TaxID=958 RepID=UPI0035A882BA